MTKSRHRTNPEAEWFGFEHITAGNKAERVRGVFDKVAARYDVMNDLMSLGVHRLWKDRFAAMIAPRAGESILDLAGGTGDIARRLHRRSHGQSKITICDYNAAMLEQGRNRMLDDGLLPDAFTWTTGDAADLPFPAASFDKICISFGLRNVALIDTALKEVVRVLKPGGRFFCLEFSPGVAAPLKDIYDRYSFSVLPWLGEKVANDRAAYQYLAESIRQFPDQQALAARMEQAGLARVRWLDVSFGIAAIHSGWKF
ncbi:MAG: bifunctional demethylmenaquinone methyltransferase/2-methoxy-6-polyprenyl-1,4-benzoquinol methylase UbiE [Alphaproteobacteria bacterium]